MSLRVYALALSLPFVVGCGDAPHVQPFAVTASIHGKVHGGQQPVSGASVQVYTVGYLGDGGASHYFGIPVHTDANGNFNLNGTFMCPGGYAAAYLMATGGNPGLQAGTNNTALSEMLSLGSCNAIDTQTEVSINELTTIASLYPLLPFTTNYKNIAYNYATDYPAFGNDFAMEAEYVNPETGQIPGPSLPLGYTAPTAKLNSLANSVAACINSAGGVANDGSPCGTLFADTTPPSGTPPTNTADAIINLSRYPTLNTTGIFNLATAAAPFQPSLTSAPADWTIGLVPARPNSPTYPLCTMWGDSLTEGNEDSSGVTIPSFLATLNACAQTSNQGVGGQTSTQIAVREGAVASTGTIVGGTIPASGSVTITFPAGYEPVTGQDPNSTDITISGVEGLVANNGSGGYMFTRSAAGSPVASAANQPFTVNIGNLNSGFVIIWAGRNDTNGSQLLSNIAAMVQSLPFPRRFLILSIINNDTEVAGTTPYTNINQWNAALAAAYPNNFLDARSLVVADYDPTNPEDVLDHNNDVPPSSLRAFDAFGNLNTAIPDAVSCSFSVNLAVGYGETLLVGSSEKIFVESTDTTGQTVTGCIRGYAGTTATSHPSGQGFSGIDPLHLNGPVADVFLAGQINAWIQTNIPPQ